MQTESLVFCLC